MAAMGYLETTVDITYPPMYRLKSPGILSMRAMIRKSEPEGEVAEYSLSEIEMVIRKRRKVLRSTGRVFTEAS